jgi:hypothetical protein
VPGQAPHIPTVASYALPVRSGPLREAFNEARLAAVAARTAALATLRGEHQAYARRRHDGTETARREAEERRRVRTQHPLPTWQGFLEQEAANGNQAALAALRERLPRPVHREAQFLAAQGAGDVRHIVRHHMRPSVLRDGSLIYRTADGGVVSDAARVIEIRCVTDAAVSLALSLARDRFGHRSLTVKGTEDFRSRVAECAGADNLEVRFVDHALEQRRLLARELGRNGPARDHADVQVAFHEPDAPTRQSLGA